MPTVAVIPRKEAEWHTDTTTRMETTVSLRSLVWHRLVQELAPRITDDGDQTSYEE